MKNLRLVIILIVTCLFATNKAFALAEWNNDLRTLFISNKANIYAVNIRTFNATDTDNDGIIEENEERGNFINAIDKLDNIANTGINVVQLLPITPVGKTKALGTAGSLFAASSFNEINPQLKSPDSKMTLEDEVRKFIDECHKRNLRVIVDLPSCGSYDLYLNHPEYFAKDKNQKPIIPSDWTDVRLFDTGTDTTINNDVLNLYTGFVDYMVDLGVDGIRADNASLKPYSFWKSVIDTTRARNPQFLFLAEASQKDKPISGAQTFTPYNKLLEAGFDGIYGGYTNFKNCETARELYSIIKSNLRIQNKYSHSKSVLADFTTHDQISPILVNGERYSEMLLWLNATLPLNPYYIDGFATGDDYIYFWANKKAPKSYTDDDFYFTHRGQLDIFNFSRKPQGKHFELFKDFVIANRFKVLAGETLSNGNFKTLMTSSPSVFAFSRSANNQTVIVIGNLDFKSVQRIRVHVPKINSNTLIVPIKMQNIPTVSKGKISTNLAPGEVMVLLLSSFELK